MHGHTLDRSGAGSSDPQQERHRHRSCSVRRRHEERPHAKLPASDRHPAPAWVFRPNELRDADREQDRRDDPLHRVERQRHADQADDDRRYRDCCRVTTGQREQGAPYRAPLLPLHPERHREQPPHTGIDPVYGPEQQQRCPGPHTVRHVRRHLVDVHRVTRSRTSRTMHCRPGVVPGADGSRPRTRAGSSDRT